MVVGFVLELEGIGFMVVWVEVGWCMECSRIVLNVVRMLVIVVMGI